MISEISGFSPNFSEIIPILQSLLTRNFQKTCKAFAIPADVYLFKVNNGNSGSMCSKVNCSKLIIKTSEYVVFVSLVLTLNILNTHFSGVSITDFEQVNSNWSVAILKHLQDLKVPLNLIVSVKRKVELINFIIKTAAIVIYSSKKLAL